MSVAISLPTYKLLGWPKMAEIRVETDIKSLQKLMYVGSVRFAESVGLISQVCQISGTDPGPSGILACYESRSGLSPLPGDWRTSALPESPAPSAGSLLPRPQQGWPIFGRLSSILIWLVPILIKMIYACNIKS